METLIVVTVVVIALAVVVAPLLSARKQAVAYTPADLDADVARYRAATQAGTVCPRCAEASPPDSRYCMRCGRRMAPTAAVKHA